LLPGLSAVGTGLSIYGSILKGQQQSQALQYRSTVEEQNATSAMTAAVLNANKQQMQFAKMQGQDIANYGASGVSGESGSVLDTLASNAKASEMDKQSILYGGQIKAVNYQNQASIDKTQAGQALTAGYINAAASLFGGGAKMLGQFGGGGGSFGDAS
jgi:hypothetical protein